MLKCSNLYYHNTCKPTFPYQRLISIRHRLGILARRPTLSLELHKRSLVVLFFLVRIFETKKCSYLTKRKRGALWFGVKVPLILSIRRKCCVADQRANCKGTWFNIVRCSVAASHSTSPPSNQANNTLSKYHVFVKQINPMRFQKESVQGSLQEKRTTNYVDYTAFMQQRPSFFIQCKIKPNFS